MEILHKLVKVKKNELVNTLPTTVQSANLAIYHIKTQLQHLLC